MNIYLIRQATNQQELDAAHQEVLRQCNSEYEAAHILIDDGHLAQHRDIWEAYVGECIRLGIELPVLMG